MSINRNLLILITLLLISSLGGYGECDNLDRNERGPGAFSLISPSDGATNQSLTPTLSWNASDGATSYTVQIGTDEGFNIGLVLTQTGITTTSFTVPASTLSTNTTYYWRVTAFDNQGSTINGLPFSFTTGSSSSTPSDSALSGLTLSTGSLSPAFAAATTSYTSTVCFLIHAVTVTPTASSGSATIMVNGTNVTSGAASGSIALAAGSATAITIVVTTSSSSTTYSLMVTRQSSTSFAQQAYGKASNTRNNDEFGYSVSLSGDTLAVGAPYEDSDATGINGNQASNLAPDAGAVYVFIRNGTTWSQQAYIKASNAGTGDLFGYSVSLSGDTLAVGARSESSDATGINGNQLNDSSVTPGAVYVFVRNGTTWSQQAYIKASNTGAGDFFGWSVSLSGDTLAVGARDEDSDATGINGNQAGFLAANSGAVYVFVRNGTTWSQQAYIKASNTGAGDHFGHSVSVSVDTLAVGARFETSNASGINGNQANNSASQSGAVYVFVRNGTTWSQQAYIKASSSGANKLFGHSVSVSGDTLAVGAIFESSNATGINGNQANNSASQSGAVYVFVRNGTTWSQQAYIKASNTGTSDFFGWSVSLSGDTLVVGAPQEFSNATGINGNQADNSASGSGAVYVFARNGTTWSQQAYIKASNTESSDEFGHSVSLSGDSLAAGAREEASNATGINGNQADNSGNRTGAIYIFK